MPLWKRNSDKSAGIQFLRTQEADTATYHIYQGPSRKVALEFLRQKPVKDELVYDIVETPEGNVGRDLIHIFNEVDGSPIELGHRPSAGSPVPSSTRCAWCGFTVIPVMYSLNDQLVGSVTFHYTLDELRTMVKVGGGLECGQCSLLQCAVCAGLAEPGIQAGEMSCRSCGGGLSVHKHATGQGRGATAAKVQGGENDQMVTFPADPLGDELWGLAPLRVPWSIDVKVFLSRPQLPYLWPDDSDYMTYIGSGERAQRILRASWINVFLHHPNPEVVLQCLRDAPPDNMVNLAALADLLASPAEPRVKDEAASVTWRLSDGSISHLLKILLSRGIIASNYETHAVHDAISRLRAACPRERLTWLDSELSRPEDD